nr:hypothetical protein [Sandarakinorhabdus rubra]
MAGAAIYLASRARDYVIGGTITVDGGIAHANTGAGFSDLRNRFTWVALRFGLISIQPPAWPMHRRGSDGKRLGGITDGPALFVAL